MIIVLFIIYVLLTVSGLILFKLGSTDLNFALSGSKILFSLNIQFILGIICYLFSFILWLYIVSKTKLSVSLPISVGLVNGLVLIGASIFLNEKITYINIIGVVFIVIGISFIVITSNNI